MLTHRIAHLIRDLGAHPSEILAITFTNKAANEMRERNNVLLREILEEAAASGAAKGTNEQKVGDFWTTGMDTDTIEAAQAAPLAADLERRRQPFQPATFQVRGMLVGEHHQRAEVAGGDREHEPPRPVLPQAETHGQSDRLRKHRGTTGARDSVQALIPPIVFRNPATPTKTESSPAAWWPGRMSLTSPTTILPRFGLFEVYPSLPFLFALAWSLLSSVEEGVVWAFIGGLFMDIFTIAPVGGLSLTYMVAVFVSGLIGDLLPANRFVFPVLVTVFATTVQQLLYMLYLRIFGISINATMITLVQTVVIQAILIIPIYWLMYLVKRTIRPRPVQI